MLNYLTIFDLKNIRKHIQRVDCQEVCLFEATQQEIVLNITVVIIVVIIISIAVVIIIIMIYDEQEDDHDGHQCLLLHHGQHDGGRSLHQRRPQNLERAFANLCSLIFQV